MSAEVDALSENAIKSALDRWLRSQGWNTSIAWGGSQGIDIDARREKDRWIIEVKGRGSRPQMRVNYFLSLLGETLQRMSDSEAKYSIGLADLPQMRRLWERLPTLAKARVQISALFVDENGNVEEHH